MKNLSIAAVTFSLLVLHTGATALAIAPDSAIIAKDAVDVMIPMELEPHVKSMQPSRPEYQPPSKIQLPSGGTKNPGPGKSENPKDGQDDPANQVSKPQPRPQ